MPLHKPNRLELKQPRWRKVWERDGKVETETWGTLLNTLSGFFQLWSFFASFTASMTTTTDFPAHTLLTHN